MRLHEIGRRRAICGFVALVERFGASAALVSRGSRVSGSQGV